MLIIITSATENTETYTSVFIFSLAMGTASTLYWKDLVNLFNISSEATQMFIDDNVGKLREKVKETRILPPSLQMRLSSGVEGLKEKLDIKDMLLVLELVSNSEVMLF